MARPLHKHASLAQYLYVERGLTDLDQLATMTGISAGTLERYRADQGWVELRQAREQGRESQIQSLDDVADTMIRILLQKAQEFETLPVEMIDPDMMRGIRQLVETVKLLTAELRRLGKRDKLLVMCELTDYVLQQEQEQYIDAAALHTVLELIGGYSDMVLEGNHP